MKMYVSGGFEGKMREKVNEEFDRCMYIIYSKFDNIVFEPIEVKFNSKMRSRGGTANYRKREINLNSRLLEKHPENLLQTFVHELSHILTYDIFGIVHLGKRVPAHGKQWKGIMRSLGYTPDRCHNMDASEFKQKRRKFLARCGCKSHEIGAKRKRNMESGTVRYRCRSCHERLELVSETNDSNLKKEA